jgi:hypothetical protein
MIGYSVARLLSVDVVSILLRSKELAEGIMVEAVSAFFPLQQNLEELVGAQGNTCHCLAPHPSERGKQCLRQWLARDGQNA